MSGRRRLEAVEKVSRNRNTSAGTAGYHHATLRAVSSRMQRVDNGNLTLFVGVDPTVVSSAAISRATIPTTECQVDSFDLLAALATPKTLLMGIAWTNS